MREFPIVERRNKMVAIASMVVGNPCNPVNSKVKDDRAVWPPIR
jgi:hypothetical protein